MRDSGVLLMGRSQWNQGLELCLGAFHVRRFRKHTIWEKISDLIRQSYFLGTTNKHGITDSRKYCSMGKEALRPNKMWESSRSPVHRLFPTGLLRAFENPLVSMNFQGLWFRDENCIFKVEAAGSRLQDWREFCFSRIIISLGGRTPVLRDEAQGNP